LAGQCGKLKCCLNFELDSYLDAQKDFPSSNIPLETEKGTYYFLKADIFSRKFWYTSRGDAPSGLIEVSVDRVKKIQQMNRAGKRPEKLVTEEKEVRKNEAETFHNMVGQEDLTRFDRQKSQPRKKKRHHGRNANRKPATNENS
jgi:hypothetical protein